MKKYYTFFTKFFLLSVSLLVSLCGTHVFASPYGMGKYGSLVPYGGQTSLTISTSGNIAIPITPGPSAVLGTATGTVTVVSTDVRGYLLYIRGLNSSSLVAGVRSIPASVNTTAGALATDTWGYNMDGSTNFFGIKTTDTLIKSLSGPAEAGDVTSVTYGVKVDNTQAAGNYTQTVMYTAVPQTN